MVFQGGAGQRLTASLPGSAPTTTTARGASETSLVGTSLSPYSCKLAKAGVRGLPATEVASALGIILVSVRRGRVWEGRQIPRLWLCFGPGRLGKVADSQRAW